jgi:hypothetical protein
MNSSVQNIEKIDEKKSGGIQTASTGQFTMNRLLLKIKYSFYSALVFFLFANPETYRVLHSVFKNSVSFIDIHGVPTTTGFFVSTVLFFITMLGLMLMPSI